MSQPLRVGINGFGRIGRIVARIIAQDPTVELVAINDPKATPDYMEYQLRYDTVHGRFKGEVSHTKDSLTIAGQTAALYACFKPTEIPWGKHNVDIVFDCTGVFKGLGDDSAGGHILAGAKHVIISAPADNGVPTFVHGVNHTSFTKDMKVVSNASCTTNCLAPIAKVLDDNWGITAGLMTTVHAATATQFTVDSISKKDPRGGRSVFNNIIPSSTGAAKAVGLVLPQLKGKLTGMAFRVPTADVSAVDLTVQLAKPATYDEIKAAMKKASETTLKGVLAYTEDDVVSSDFIGEPCTAVFDAKAGIALNPQFVKVVAFYDNEYGYSYSIVELAKYMNGVQ